jgi:hypothetical protein
MPDTSSFGRVIDALVAIPAQAQYVTLFADTVVWDGPWPESNKPNNLLMVGYDDAGEVESAGTELPATFGPNGGGRIAEDYGVPCKITRWTGDTGAGVQKRIRDETLAQFAAFELTIRTNGTLNGLITPPPSGQPVSTWIETVGYRMTDPDVPSGRVFTVLFTVHVQNSLNA